MNGVYTIIYQMKDCRFGFIIIVCINSFQIWKICSSIIFIIVKSYMISKIINGIFKFTTGNQRFAGIMNIHYTKSVLKKPTLSKCLVLKIIIGVRIHVLPFWKNNERWFI